MNPFSWLEWIVSWVLVAFHDLAAPFLGSDSGVTWTLSIVGLVLVIRILLIPLFVKQIRSMRNMQLIQPQVKEIQKKFAGDRERQSQELMKLYRETKTNPLSSCLPILAQAPIFFALFQVLNGIGRNVPKGVLTPDLVASARAAEFFGVPLHATFIRASELLAEVPPTPTSRTYIVTVILIILMSASTFLTQKQMIAKNTAPDNPIVQQQKILLYVFPLIFMVSGVNFPIGVLLYWLTTNIWSMGQQFWVIRNSPAPGTPAFEAWEQRKANKRRKGRSPAVEDETPTDPGTTATKPVPPPRQQPRRKPRSKRK
jgi:YidC/Oxa1 family membrane protein insertase